MTARDAGYRRALGARLRQARVQSGMSLHDVQVASGGRWKAAAVGAYERGERNITVSRLVELADFYQVPVTAMLPHAEPSPAAPVETSPRVVLDLEALGRLPEPDRELVARFAAAIQDRRGDFGRTLTVREEDLATLALIHGTTVPELARRLAEWGVVRASEGPP